MFYNSPAEYPTFLVSVNFNYGIGYSF
jgi:hypothetical protein